MLDLLNIILKWKKWMCPNPSSTIWLEHKLSEIIVSEFNLLSWTVMVSSGWKMSKKTFKMECHLHEDSECWSKLSHFHKKSFKCGRIWVHFQSWKQALNTYAWQYKWQLTYGLIRSWHTNRMQAGKIVTIIQTRFIVQN